VRLRPNLLLLPLLVAGLVGLGVWGLQEQQRRRSQAETPPPTLPRRVSALGRVEPLDGVVKLSVPSSLANDPVREVLVKDGDQVRRGQPLAVLESARSLATNVAEAQAAVGVAERKLAAQSSVIEKNRAELAQAEVELRRYSQLFEAGASSAEQRDRRSTIRSTSQANLDQAIADQRTLAAELEEARATLERDRAEQEKATIRAPFDGTVFKIYAHPGDKVGDNGILDIGNSGRMGVIAEVYQTDRPLIALGQRAVISADGFPGRQVTGKVVEIARQVSRQSVFSGEAGENLDRRVLEVKIGLSPEATVQASYLNYLQVNVVFDPLTPEQQQAQQQRKDAVIRSGGAEVRP
jgi:HlyD family secretion protein